MGMSKEEEEDDDDDDDDDDGFEISAMNCSSTADMYSVFTMNSFHPVSYSVRSSNVFVRI